MTSPTIPVAGSALKMFGEPLSSDSFEARAIAAGHSLVLDDEGEIDAFVFNGSSCNGPGCATCGWSACRHCDAAIPACVRPHREVSGEGNGSLQPQEAVVPVAAEGQVSGADLAGFVSDIAASDVTSEDVNRCQLEVLYGRILSKKDRQEISQILGVLKAILERARQ